MNYVVPPEAPNHLSRATLPCLPEQCNYYGKSFSRKFSLSKQVFVVNGASRPVKILQDRYMAKLMALRRIGFGICHITIKPRIS